jgi:putative ABC transport system permease protein
MHAKGRSVLAVVGIFVAVLLIFLELGFYFSVPKGGMTIYDKLRFDIMLASSAYFFQGQSFDFPRRRLFQATALPEVAAAAPLYQGNAPWFNKASVLRRDVFVMGFNLNDRVFDVADIDRQIDALKRPDTVLVDQTTRPMFGAVAAGGHVEIGDRAVEIAGTYGLGTGFIGLGVVTTSDLNFIRIFPNRTLGEVNLGLVTLRPGADPDHVAASLRAMLPPDTRVFTRAELARHEIAHWVTATSTGIVFGFGVVVSVIVGTVILYQTLSTQIRHQLPQYAALKAIGYRDRYLGDVVVILALIMAAIAYVLAVACTFVIYHVVRSATNLPVTMTGARLVTVLLVTLTMSAGSALLAVRSLRRANPVDLF